MDFIETIKLALLVSIPFIILVSFILIGIMIIVYILYKQKQISHSYYRVIKVIIVALLILSFVGSIGYDIIFSPSTETNIQEQ